MSEQKPPDFAMLRAVEILANIHERQYTQPNVPPPPLDRPVVLFNEECPIAVGMRDEAVRDKLGWGFAYPTRGWHTYAVAGDSGERLLLSLFYKEGALIAAELYVPKTDRTPNLEPRRLGAFRFTPGDVRIGMPVTSVPPAFVSAIGGPGPVVYDTAFEARFDGGVAYIMGKQGTIERLALYAQHGERRT